MSEYIVQIAPMLVLAGIATGWTAEALSRAGGYGFIHDMVLGLIGSVLAGATLWIVIANQAGMPMMFLVGCTGAILVIAAQRSLWRSGALGA
jgi:uncharacterized membrane protein YeaQ/YmgE (transglycosylase-associated protein family)